MTVRGEILVLILLCALVTVIPRVLPFLTAHRMRLSPVMVAWFRFLPAAILSALLAPAIFAPGGEWLTTPLAPELLATCACAVIALKTRSIIPILITGMLTYAAFSAVL